MIDVVWSTQMIDPSFPSASRDHVKQWPLNTTGSIPYPSGRSLFLASLSVEDDVAVAGVCKGGAVVGIDVCACGCKVVSTEWLEALRATELREVDARVLVPFLMGALTLVDMFRMSFPWMVSWLFDFFKSSVNISMVKTSVRAKCRANWSLILPSPPTARSNTLDTCTFITPRNPWSFFLNFFWSNTCTAITLELLTCLIMSTSY